MSPQDERPEGDADADADGDADAAGLSAHERGDTVGRGSRWLVRLAIAVVVLGGVGVTVLVTNGIPDRVAALASSVLSGVFGPAAPVATGTPTPSARPTGTAAANGSATAPATSAAAPSTTAAAPAPNGIAAPAPAAPAAPAPAGTGAANGSATAPAGTAAPTATPTPTSTLAPYPVDEGDAAQAALVAADDVRWSGIVRAGTGGAANEAAPEGVLVLAARATPYTFTDLVALGAVGVVDDTRMLLQKTVFVGRDAALELDAAGQTLLLDSGAAGYHPIVVWGGTLTMRGAEGHPLTVSSWDGEALGPDLDLDDGRAYIRVAEGTLVTDHVIVNDLGYWSGRTGGVSLTGSAAVPATGSITSSTFSGQHIGLYLTSARDVTITDALVRDSAQQGIEIGPNSRRITIDASAVSGSGSNGVNARPGSSAVTITDTTLSRNGGYGLRFDGTPRAEGPNSGGFSVANAHGLTVTGSTLADNRSGGASVVATSEVLFDGNTVTQKTVGLLLRDSQATVTDNTITVKPGNGVVFTGEFTSASVTGNTIAGEGPSAVAQREGAEDVTVAANDASGWAEQWEVLLWVEAHPLALLWALLLVIPIIGIAFVFYRVRRQQKIRELVESATIALAKSDIEKYEAARTAAVVSPAESAVVDAVSADAARVEPTAVELSEPAAGEAPAPAIVAEERPNWYPAEIIDDEYLEHDDDLEGAEGVEGAEGADGADGVEHGVGVSAGDEPVPGVVSPRSPSPATDPVPASASDPVPASASASAPASPARAARPASTTTRTTQPVPGRAPARRPDSAPVNAAKQEYGRFATVEELAVAAVLDAGKPIDRVANAVRVPVSTVAGWVAKARRQRENASR